MCFCFLIYIYIYIYKISTGRQEFKIPYLVRYRPSTPSLDRLGRLWAQFWPHRAVFGRTWSKFDQIWSNFDQHLSNFDQKWSNFYQNWSNFDQSWSKFDQDWSKFDQRSECDLTGDRICWSFFSVPVRSLDQNPFDRICWSNLLIVLFRPDPIFVCIPFDLCWWISAGLG